MHEKIDCRLRGKETERREEKRKKEEKEEKERERDRSEEKSRERERESKRSLQHRGSSGASIDAKLKLEIVVQEAERGLQKHERDRDWNRVEENK